MKYQYTCDGMLTLECQTAVQLVLNKEQASELSTRVAKDLFAMLGIQGDNALVYCGALFATEQLLQPQFPLQKHITQYASAAFQGSQHDSQVLSIGAHQNQMPDGLQPLPAAQQLMHMPFCLYTNDVSLAETFEAELMHKGMISPPTYQLLHSLLNKQSTVVVNHANYMTYLDLVAMMHNHYEQLGMSHVWQIIETALLDKAPKQALVTDTHNHFYLLDHMLFTPFFTWPQFQQYFADSGRQDYINWLMAQRLSISALTAHGLEIKTFTPTEWPLNSNKICLGSFEKSCINQSFYTDPTTTNKISPDDQSNDVVTYHQDNQAGLVAITVQSPEQGWQIHYPINPKGITDIKQHLKHSLGDDMTYTTKDFMTNNQDMP